MKRQLQERKTQVLHLQRERQLEQNCMCLLVFFVNRPVYLYYKKNYKCCSQKTDVIICKYYEEVVD